MLPLLLRQQIAQHTVADAPATPAQRLTFAVLGVAVALLATVLALEVVSLRRFRRRTGPPGAGPTTVETGAIGPPNAAQGSPSALRVPPS